MAKFIVYKVVQHETVVEAEDVDAAFEIAHNLSVRDFDQDYEVDLMVEHYVE